MDRRRLTWALLLAFAALVLCLRQIDAHGFWFDEAYSARIAALAPARLWHGATVDIHPPGWPLVCALFLRLPLPAEVALRLPSTLALVLLTGLVAWRSPLMGVGLLVYEPLVEQGTQGRPYALLALMVVMVAETLRRGHWGLGGVLTGITASLHALGLIVVAPVVLATCFSQRPDKRALARGVAGALGTTIWWLPAFLESARGYANHPWYGPAEAAEWLFVADGWPGALGILVTVALSLGRSRSALVPFTGVLCALVALELAGIGVEIRKVGIILAPLLFAELGASGTRAPAALAAALGLTLGHARIDDRADLREARDAVSALSARVPVLSVFASEASWYLRTPAPLPSDRDPAGVAARIRAALDSQHAECACVISLPGTWPDPSQLGPGVGTRMVASVTGLDVRVAGTAACNIDGDPAIWHRVGQEASSVPPH